MISVYFFQAINRLDIKALCLHPTWWYNKHYCHYCSVLVSEGCIELDVSSLIWTWTIDYCTDSPLQNPARTKSPVMLNEAKTSRPRPWPKLRGRGQDYEVEAEAKNNYEKVPNNMINNIWYNIIAGKINKIPEFYTIFAGRMPDYIIRQRDRGQAEAKTSRPRPKLRGRGTKFCPWGQSHFGLEDLTSLQITKSHLLTV